MFEDKKIQFTTLAMGANITRLQNIFAKYEFISQLRRYVTRDGPLAILVC
jgi:hypothetical protein